MKAAERGDVEKVSSILAKKGVNPGKLDVEGRSAWVLLVVILSRVRPWHTNEICELWLSTCNLKNLYQNPHSKIFQTSLSSIWTNNCPQYERFSKWEREYYNTTQWSSCLGPMANHSLGYLVQFCFISFFFLILLIIFDPHSGPLKEVGRSLQRLKNNLVSSLIKSHSLGYKPKFSILEEFYKLHCLFPLSPIHFLYWRN